MKKNKNILIWLVTISFVAAIFGVVTQATREVQQLSEETCYANLERATRKLADDFHKSAEMDRMILNAMSSVIASEENPTESMLCAVMNSYSSIESYINYVEILRPDDKMLDSDGELRDVSGTFAFQDEIKKGSYISEVTWSTKDPEEKIIRNAVPVVVDEQTAFMLYGVIRLSELKKTYTTDIYDGNGYVYLVEGATGDLFLDTWHNRYGNLSDFYDRECLSEDDFSVAAQKMQQGMSGKLSFRSKSTGDIQYMHYEPIGLNGWIVCVTIQDRYAFISSIRIQTAMKQMAVLLSVIVFLYLLFVISMMMQAYRRIQDVGLNDKITGLKNRNAYDVFLEQHRSTKKQLACCVYVDANGLHELNNREGHAAGDRMLSRIAEELKKEFPPQTVYRVGGDEFVVITTEFSETVCEKKIRRVYTLLDKQGYSIAYGIAAQRDATGFAEVIHLADEKMIENKKRYYAEHKGKMR